MIKKSMDESNQGFMKHLGGLELKKLSDTQYEFVVEVKDCLLYTSPSPRDMSASRMPSSA